MAQIYPGALNTYTPAFNAQRASDEMIVEYSRNPASFALNKYSQIRRVDERAGYFARMNTDYAVRVVTANEHAWNDSTDRPTGRNRPFEFVPYTTRRYSDGFRIGGISRDQAAWDIIASHARGSASQMMTLRSLLAVTQLTTSGNWGGNTDTAANVGGGVWTGSTAANAYIQKTFQTVIENVAKKTGGAVRASDLCCVISPETAHDMAQAPEIIQYVINQPAALQYFMSADIFQTYSLPPSLWGVQIIVEDAVRVSGREEVNQKEAGSYVMGNFAAFVARPGGQQGIDNNPQAPTLSTLTCFIHEEMSVETFDDAENRRTNGYVTEDYVFELTAPASGYLVSSVRT